MRTPVARLTRLLAFMSVFLFTAMLWIVLPGAAMAESGKIIVQLLGHYTDDKEWFGEEWTFEANVRFVATDGELGEWRPIPFKQNIWSGDSDPDNNDWHEFADDTIFERTFLQLPEKIEIKQRGWEDDRGQRRIYNCCSWWRNDDDDYGAGSTFINVSDLEANTWKTYDWPNFHGPHGLKVRAKLEQAVARNPPAISRVSPAKGCRGAQNINVNMSGTNFAQGMQVEIQGAGVTTHDINVASSTSIDMQVDIAATALATSRNVRVFQPGEPLLADTLNNGFQVLASSAPECTQTIRIKPNAGCQGQSNQSVAITGDGFVAGMTVTISGLGVTVHDVVVESDTMIRMKVDIGPLAPTTSRTVKVFPPGQTTPSAVLENGYQVLDRDRDDRCTAN